MAKNVILKQKRLAESLRPKCRVCEGTKDVSPEWTYEAEEGGARTYLCSGCWGTALAEGAEEGRAERAARAQARAKLLGSARGARATRPVPKVEGGMVNQIKQWFTEGKTKKQVRAELTTIYKALGREDAWVERRVSKYLRKRVLRDHMLATREARGLPPAKAKKESAK